VNPGSDRRNVTKALCSSQPLWLVYVSFGTSTTLVFSIAVTETTRRQPSSTSSSPKWLWSFSNATARPSTDTCTTPDDTT
jgi:uncharacterized membrane protein YdcZ (DUF606 family)